MHTSLLIPYFSFQWTFPSHCFYVLINYQKSWKSCFEFLEPSWNQLAEPLQAFGGGCQTLNFDGQFTVYFGEYVQHTMQPASRHLRRKFSSELRAHAHSWSTVHLLLSCLKLFQSRPSWPQLCSPVHVSQSRLKLGAAQALSAVTAAVISGSRGKHDPGVRAAFYDAVFAPAAAALCGSDGVSGCLGPCGVGLPNGHSKTMCLYVYVCMCSFVCIFAILLIYVYTKHGPWPWH